MTDSQDEESSPRSESSSHATRGGEGSSGDSPDPGDEAIGRTIINLAKRIAKNNPDYAHRVLDDARREVNG